MSKTIRDRCGQRRRTHTVLALTALVSAGACASSGPASSSADVATDAVWRSISEPRPAPLPGAARVAMAGVEFLGSYPWSSGAVTPEIGVAELVTAGLLRRRDVLFVERRRFAAAAAAARAGERPRPGSPPIGVSQSAEFTVTAVWIPVGSEQASVEVRLTTLQTGGIAGATRIVVSPDADAVVLARAIVGGLIDVLGEIDRLPVWDDPLSGQPDASRVVPPQALARFLQGLAAEEAWDWEGARRSYQASEHPNFHEASTVLARAARLRLGGTLAES